MTQNSMYLLTLQLSKMPFISIKTITNISGLSKFRKILQYILTVNSTYMLKALLLCILFYQSRKPAELLD